jgi:hypothetical protein
LCPATCTYPRIEGSFFTICGGILVGMRIGMAE